MPKGLKGFQKGQRFTDEHRKKISEARKGSVFTEEHKRKIGEANKGHRHTKETKKRIGEFRKGKKLSLETRKKISKAKIGKVGSNLGKRWKCSLQGRRNMSEARKGEKSYQWKGGVTAINQRIRSSLEYRLWRTSVFERDGYACVWCGARNGNGKTIVLNADHIKPFAYFPELRFAINNGRTLCIDCHRKTYNYKKPKEYIK